MNSSIEELFVTSFISKRAQNRVIFELSSSKNRSKAISRFAHTADEIIDSTCITIKNEKLTNSEIEVELVKLCHKNKEVYVISMNELDGQTLPLKDALKICMNDYMPTIIICSEKVVFIKAETSYGSPMKYILTKKEDNFNNKYSGL